MKFILGLFGVAIVLFTLFIVVSLAIGKTGRIETWKARVERFTSDDNQDNYQTDQAKIAIAGGGLFGRFPGTAKQEIIFRIPILISSMQSSLKNMV